MSAPDVRGWCPSLHEPMAAADGLIVRVKSYVRGLSAPDLRRIAESAEIYGSGRIELTSRGALQVRGLNEAGAMAFAQTMVEAGLASADAAVERRRNLQLAPSCEGELLALATAAERWLAQDAALAALPAKFGYGFSPEIGIEADIVVLGDDAHTILIGGAVAVQASPAPLEAMHRLTHAFLSLAAELPKPPRRMKALIAAVGVEAVLAEAGLAACTTPPRPVEPPRVGPHKMGFGLGVVFGELKPDMLRVVADLAERFGDGQVALSPGRSIWLRGVALGWHAALAAQAANGGLIVQMDDLRLRLHACAGRSGCATAHADVRADALRLVDHAPEKGLHVSGCAKGCAHPGAAAITLVSRGVAGGYDLIFAGAPTQAPSVTDLTLDQITERLSHD